MTAFSNQTPVRAILHDESASRWHEASLHPSADGLLAIVADITSRKRAEVERAAQAEYLQQLDDQVPAFLWVIDRDLIVRRIEGGRPMLKALDRDRLIGMSHREVTQMGCNAEDPTEKEQAVEEAASVESNQGGRVLVVEDEEHVRDVTACLLQRAGYEVSTAPDAETALGVLASSEPFDLVLTDWAMPGMRGEDLAAEITRVQPGLPVLLMSGYTDLERSPGSAAVVGFLQKPIAMPVLLAEVSRAIARERASSD